MSQTQQNDEPTRPDYSLLPEGLREGTRRWIEQGITPGSFLRSVIRGQLFEAAQRADQDNMLLLGKIALWFNMQAPEGSFGNDRVLSNWPLYLRAKERTDVKIS